jgi:hypothetical protein
LSATGQQPVILAARERAADEGRCLVITHSLRASVTPDRPETTRSKSIAEFGGTPPES